MVNGKVYKITEARRTNFVCYTNEKNKITFDLDGNVSYNNGNQKYIECEQCSPFRNLGAGVYIGIDNDLTRCYDSDHLLPALPK